MSRLPRLIRSPLLPWSKGTSLLRSCLPWFNYFLPSSVPRESSYTYGPSGSHQQYGQPTVYLEVTTPCVRWVKSPFGFRMSALSVYRGSPRVANLHILLSFGSEGGGRIQTSWSFRTSTVWGFNVHRFLGRILNVAVIIIIVVDKQLVVNTCPRSVIGPRNKSCSLRGYSSRESSWHLWTQDWGQGRVREWNLFSAVNKYFVFILVRRAQYPFPTVGRIPYILFLKRWTFRNLFIFVNNNVIGILVWSSTGPKGVLWNHWTRTYPSFVLRDRRPD